MPSRRRPTRAGWALGLAFVTAAAVAGVLATRVGADPSSTPPPTPVPPSGSPSPFPTVLHTPSPSTAQPSVRAPSAVLADLDTGQVLYQRGAGVRHPVASLTKVMTALLVLERVRLSDVITVRTDAAREGGARLGLHAGETIPVRGLLYALLLQSSNDAAIALADHVAGSAGRFVDLMNRRAAELGMDRTAFASPNGLDDRGTSTANDLLTLTRAASASPVFDRISGTKTFDIPNPSGPVRHVQNRNPLLWLYPGATGVKTGFTAAAGYSVIATARRGGVRVVAVVLEDPVEDTSFDDAAALLDQGFFAYHRRTLVQTGESLGLVRVDGHPVEVIAGDTVRWLVPTGAAVARSLTPDAGLRLPVTAGAVLGREILSVAGRPVASVPAVAHRSVQVPAPPPVRRPNAPSPLDVLAALARRLFGGLV